MTVRPILPRIAESFSLPFRDFYFARIKTTKICDWKWMKLMTVPRVIAFLALLCRGAMIAGAHDDRPNVLVLCIDDMNEWCGFLGGYTLSAKNCCYTRFFDGTEELYDHTKDPQEWTNLASIPEYAELKRDLGQKWLTKTEAARVLSGKELDNVWDSEKTTRKPKAK